MNNDILMQNLPLDNLHVLNLLNNYLRATTEIQRLQTLLLQKKPNPENPSGSQPIQSKTSVFFSIPLSTPTNTTHQLHHPTAHHHQQDQSNQTTLHMQHSLTCTAQVTQHVATG